MPPRSRGVAGSTTMVAGMAKTFEPPPVDDVLDAVGPRLRALRTERDLTLGAVSRTTGISVSTLSRLESGGRKPTLELLLPLARAYQVALDDLVEAPPPADPRVHPRPFDRNGMTMVPLTRQTAGCRPTSWSSRPRWPAVAARAEGARRLRVALRAVRPPAPAARRPGLRARRRRGGRVRHPRAARLHQPVPRAGGGAHPVRPAGRAHARPRPPRRPDRAFGTESPLESAGLSVPKARVRRRRRGSRRARAPGTAAPAAHRRARCRRPTGTRTGAAGRPAR